MIAQRLASLLLLLLLPISSSDAFFQPLPRVQRSVTTTRLFQVPPKNLATSIPSSFDPFAFDGVEENWSSSFNNPFVMASYARYLETGQLDPHLERVLMARQRRMEEQSKSPSKILRAAYPDIPSDVTDDANRKRLWIEGEERRQRDLEKRMKEPRKPVSTRWVQGPRKPEPPLSDPKWAIQQAPRVPPLEPPARPY